MTGRDRLHRDRCGTISIDPEDVRPDDNHPNDPPDDFSRPDLYDPYGALAVPRWVDGRLSPDDEEGMRWHRSHHFDRRAVALADRHYSRKTPGSPQFCPPGRRCVLITEAGDACWVTSAPKAEYVAHAWPGAWVNTFFRNESGHLSSGLIREALAASRAILGDPPAEGIITFIDERKIRHKRDPGRCYRKAGWRVVGRAKGGQLVLHLAPSEFPPATEPANTQMALPFVA